MTMIRVLLLVDLNDTMMLHRARALTLVPGSVCDYKYSIVESDSVLMVGAQDALSQEKVHIVSNGNVAQMTVVAGQRHEQATKGAIDGDRI